MTQMWHWNVFRADSNRLPFKGHVITYIGSLDHKTPSIAGFEMWRPWPYFNVACPQMTFIYVRVLFYRVLFVFLGPHGVFDITPFLAHLSSLSDKHAIKKRLGNQADSCPFITWKSEESNFPPGLYEFSFKKQLGKGFWPSTCLVFAQYWIKSSKTLKRTRIRVGTRRTRVQFRTQDSASSFLAMGFKHKHLGSLQFNYIAVATSRMHGMALCVAQTPCHWFEIHINLIIISIFTLS